MSDFKNIGVTPGEGAKPPVASFDRDSKRRMGIAISVSLGVNALLFQLAGMGQSARASVVPPPPGEPIIKYVRQVEPKAPTEPTPAPTPIAEVTPEQPEKVIPPVVKPPVEKTPDKVAVKPPVDEDKTETKLPPVTEEKLSTQVAEVTPSPKTPDEEIVEQPSPAKETAELTPKEAATQPNAAPAVAESSATAEAVAAKGRTAASEIAAQKDSTLQAQPSESAATTVAPATQREIAAFSAQKNLRRSDAGGATQNAKSQDAKVTAADIASAATGASPANIAGRGTTGPAETLKTDLRRAANEPQADSTFTGANRQFTTVPGLASPVKGRTNVTTLNAKAAAVSPGSFTMATGGLLKSGEAAARQGGAGSSAVASVSGSLTTLAAKGEYAVYAPPSEVRGVIGIRRPAGLPISGTVTKMASKDTTGQKAVDDGGFATADNRKANGTQGRTTTSTATVNGSVDAKSGDDLNAAPMQGESRTADSGAVKGNITGPRAKQISPNGSPKETGDPTGKGQASVDGLANGTQRTGAAEARTERAGEVKGTKDGGPTAKTGDGELVKGGGGRSGSLPPLTITPEDPDTPYNGSKTQIAAKVLSRPTFDLPDNLRSTRFKGVVKVKVIVEKDGSHTESIVEGSRNAELDAAILNYVHGWKWEPAKQDGAPVRYEGTTRITIGVG